MLIGLKGEGEWLWAWPEVGFRSGRFLPNLFANSVGRSMGGVRGQVGGASVDDRCQMQGWTKGGASAPPASLPSL